MAIGKFSIAKLLACAIAVLGGTALVQAACGSYPSQLHLSLGGEDSMVVSWTFFSSKWCSEAYRPFVSYSAVNQENATTLFSKDCYIDSNFFGEYYVFCNIPNLKPDTVYRYMAGDVDNGVSSTHTFRTSPADGSATRIGIFGDLGVDNVEGTIATLKEAVNTRYTDLLLHAGDISYADNERILGPNKNYDRITNEFFDLIEPISSRAPYLVTPGNHDVTCHILGDEGCYDYHRNFNVFNTRFSMPSETCGGAKNMWYSINYGDIHLVSINTETDYKGSPYVPEPGRDTTAGGFGDQMKWLEEDLTKANLPESLAVRPWIVVVGHRPLYSSSITDYPPDQETRTRAAFEEVLQRHNVNLYISGHVHDYERSWPMKDGKVTKQEYGDVAPGEVVYVINGAAGNEEGHANHLSPDMPEFTAHRDNSLFGVGFLTSHKAKPENIIASVGDVKLQGIHPPNVDRMGSTRTAVPTIEEEVSMLHTSLAEKAIERLEGTADQRIYLCYAFVEAGRKPTESEDNFCLSKIIA